MSTEKTEESKEIQQTSAEEPQREGDADGGKTQKRKAKEKKKGNRNSRSVLKSLMLTAVLPVLGSGLIRFLGVNIFVTPNKFAPGGVNGASVLLEAVTDWNWGIFLLIFNVPLFFLAFFFLGKREAILSTLSMLLTAGISILVRYVPAMQFLPAYGGDGNVAHGLLGAVAGGIFLGIALAIMIKSCGTSGGTTVLASLVNKKFRNLSVSGLTSVLDAIVVLSSVFVYNDGSFTSVLDPVLLALVSLFVTSKMSDAILHGFKTAYKFEIITDCPEELAEEIMRETRHGVTKMEAEGMYSHEGKSLLVCIIRKRQIAQLQRIIKKYPGTFAYFTSTSEVYGRFVK